jgi:lipoprotein-anchoring transpeptidase ErfK/SrfK
MKRLFGYLIFAIACLAASGCTVEPANQTRQDAIASPAASVSLASPSPSPASEKLSSAQPVTLPVLDAFFADESFSALLKARLQLSDEQIMKLKQLARSETAKLSDANAGQSSGETAAARETAEEKIKALIGADKAQQLAALVRERWSGASENAAAGETARANTPEDNATKGPNAVPADSRIVVNAPAYRMDVFDRGRLIKSYKIGIGYPQFPLPTGLRKARAIIFNPTWTPPDSPWVAKMKNVSAGEKVEAGSKLNPLGPIKIPIGMPSLIHGGKSPAKLGTFASHGCVGLTNQQVQDFAKVLAELGGAHLTDAELAGYARDKTETKQLKLNKAVPVELRYETIVAEEGKLHIYRDVYDQDTNTEENLRAVLEGNQVKFEDLTEEERNQVLDALAQMSGKSSAPINRPKTLAQQSAASEASPSGSPLAKKAASKLAPRAGKNLKEIVIEIAALRGKGYPAPVDLNTGSARSKTASAAIPKTEPRP